MIIISVSCSVRSAYRHASVFSSRPGWRCSCWLDQAGPDESV